MKETIARLRDEVARLNASMFAIPRLVWNLDVGHKEHMTFRDLVVTTSPERLNQARESLKGSLSVQHRLN